jgi:hypothetical protein
VTPSSAQHGDGADARVLTEVSSHTSAVAVSETYLTMAGLRERGRTDAMIREYLRESDATRPNPRYWSAAPMKLYLAERADTEALARPLANGSGA